MKLRNDQNYEDKRAIWPFLKRMFAYSWEKAPKLLLTLLFFVSLTAIVDAAYPALFKSYMDNCLKADLAVSGFTLTPCIKKYLIYYGLFALSISSCVMAFVYTAGKISETVIYNLRKDLFEKLQYLSFSFYDKNSTGWLLTRISSDTDRVSEVISWGLVHLSWGLIMIVFCFGFMFYLNVGLALVVLLSLPVLFVVSIYIRKKILEYSRQSRRINSELTGLINEHINGIEINKALANEHKAVGIFDQSAQKLKTANYKAAIYNAAYFPIVVSVGSVATAIVVYFGGASILNNDAWITMGILSSFYIYAMLIFEPIVDIANYYSIAQSSLSAGERIFSLLDECIQIKDEANVTAFENVKGDVSLKNVTFYYKEDKPILQNFNLEIKAGQSIALVGPTGEGKTTIASLIARFYEAISGEISIDGSDYRQKSLESLRKNLGVVLQQAHVFSGKLMDNIKYGNTSATDEEVIHILEKMQAFELIKRLDEPISPDGTNLSQGEKQLIALARVFVANPAILILDEATSSIDSITELKLQDAVKELMKNRTSIVIAHRLSTIMHCDRILFIRKGQIIEDGNHESLMRKQGAYYQLQQAKEEYAM